MNSPQRTPILLFDVMSTLVYDPFYVEMPGFFGMTFDELMASKHPSAWMEFELGTMDEETFLNTFFKDGREFDHAAFKTHVVDAYRWLQGMQELTKELQAAGYAMHALSNYPNWYLEIESRLGLSRTVPWSFVSCEMGVRKPAAEAFLLPLERLGVAARDCLLVDDQASNCRAAAELGMDRILFQSAEQLRLELASRGILQTPKLGRD